MRSPIEYAGWPEYVDFPEEIWGEIGVGAGAGGESAQGSGQGVGQGNGDW